MDSARPKSPSLIPLKDAAQILGVTVEVLLSWNDHQILKPTFTVTGEIGYTQDQIDQFVRIQQSLLAKKAELLKNQASRQTQQGEQKSNLYSPAQPISSPTSRVASTQTSSLRLSLYIAGALALIILALLIQQGQIGSMLGNFRRSVEPTDAPQTSSLQLSIPPVALNKNQDSESVFTKKAPATTSAKTAPIIASGNQQVRSPIATVAGITRFQQSKPQNTPDTTTYASVATANTDSQGSAFDKSGNISGKQSQSTEIAINVAGPGFGTSTPLNDIHDFRNQIILLSLIISSAGVFFLRGKKRSELHRSVQDETAASEKIMEINQKMDGTVVLSFEGRDYKISKPELHSDSDKFIERIMEVVQTGVKEIEYDNFNDEMMKVSTPLSRLVTRLGFVGILRDLFFPRTSKHTVLFRKYITEDDLRLLNITPEDVIKDLFGDLPAGFSLRST